MWKDIEDGVFTYEELLKTRWNTVFAALGFSANGVEFEKHFKGCLFDSAIPIDGAYELLNYLKERYPLYKKYADKIIGAECEAKEVLMKIKEDFINENFGN